MNRATGARAAHTRPNRHTACCRDPAMTTTQGILEHAVGSFRDVTRRLHDLGASHPTGPRALDAHVTTLDTRESGTLTCYSAGEGDAPPILLLHSVNAAASAYEMQPLFEHYRATRRVYALDLPGFGASSRDRVDYTPKRYADAIERVLIDVVSAEPAPAGGGARVVAGEGVWAAAR